MITKELCKIAMLPYPANVIKILKIPCDGLNQQLTEDQEKGLVYVLDKFTEFEQTVFWGHYKGLLTYVEIANCYGRTKELVMRVHKRVIQRLRTEKWKPYYHDGYNKVLENRRLADEKLNNKIDFKINQIENQVGFVLSTVQIADLLFPVRINNALYHAKIFTLDDLVRLLLKEPKTVQRINGLGEKSWQMIFNALDQKGLIIPRSNFLK